LNNLAQVFELEQLEIMTTKNDQVLNQLNSDCSFLLNLEKEIYFICCLETKLDKQTKRGAILKSVSIGTTKLVDLDIFRPVALYLLEEIFKIHTFNIKDNEKIGLIKNLIKDAYKSFNGLSLGK
jgi:hypothetical protein